MYRGRLGRGTETILRNQWLDGTCQQTICCPLQIPCVTMEIYYIYTIYTMDKIYNGEGKLDQFVQAIFSGQPIPGYQW